MILDCLTLRLATCEVPLAARVLSLLLVLACSVHGITSMHAWGKENSAWAPAILSIRKADLEKHLTFLADDTLQGRAAGSTGGEAAAKYLAQLMEKAGLQPAGDRGSYFQAFNRNHKNVLGIIPGADPVLSKEFIVVGAHFDHVGLGSRSNSFGPLGLVHNGADDNASGTSALLELMEAMTQEGIETRRSILFCFWDGEEAGLLGSKYWVANPTVNLPDVVFSLNIDMLGRLREKLEIFGVRSGIGLRQVVATANEDLIPFKYDWDIKADSDHHPFLVSGIPTIMLHTGLHDEYHRPSDDVETINFNGLESCTRLACRLILDLANRDQRVSYRKAGMTENEAKRKEWEVSLNAEWDSASGPKPRVGVTWRADESESNAYYVTRVVRETPAAQAGLEVGDRIYTVNGQSLSSSDELQKMLLSSEGEMQIQVERSGVFKTLSLNIPPK